MSTDHPFPEPLRILHVEDNEADAELVRAMLRQEWPECSVTRVDARAEFEAALHKGGFDVILSDFSLPNFDGLSALQMARQRDAITPFIFVSGTIGEERAVEALHHGAMDYVLKDRPVRLLRAIRRALDFVEEQRKRKAAEGRLDESQRMLVELAEGSDDIFWSMAISPERLLFVSPAFELIWGLPRAELERDPRCWLESVHPDDRSRVTTAYERALAGEDRRFDQEYRLLRADGAERWVRDSRLVLAAPNGRLVRISGTARDISGRKRVEQELRGQAELLNKARDAIVVCDPERKVTFWNAGAERALGWTSSEAIGRSCAELLGPEVIRMTDRAEPAARTVEGLGEIQVHNREGKALLLETRVTSITDEAGQLVSYLIISTDVTEHRLLEKQFLRAQRLESIGTLAGGVAHDLNNVLTPIMMAVALLSRRNPDVETTKLLAIVEKSVVHGANLVKQVLAFARGVDGPRELLKPAGVIGDVAELMGKTLPPSITLETRVAPGLTPILGDVTQLGQVLMNLCVNARDAMPGGGRLTISAENIELEEAEARAHPGAHPGPHVLIRVSDTGTGMSPEVLERIFDPFFTTKGLGKGTGLGLATVQGILRGHGGFLDVTSEVGRGTTFALYFPVGDTEAAQPVAPEPIGEPRAGHGATVLIIEDEEGTRETCRAILQAGGYHVLAAETGEAGVFLLRQHADLVRVVVTDMMMPGLQGAEVVRQVLAIRADFPIVVMSGLSDELAKIEPKPGQIVHLPKPMTGQALLAAVAAVLPKPLDPGLSAP